MKFYPHEKCKGIFVNNQLVGTYSSQAIILYDHAGNQQTSVTYEEGEITGVTQLGDRRMALTTKTAQGYGRLFWLDDWSKPLARSWRFDSAVYDAWALDDMVVVSRYGFLEWRNRRGHSVTQIKMDKKRVVADGTRLVVLGKESIRVFSADGTVQHSYEHQNLRYTQLKPLFGDSLALFGDTNSVTLLTKTLVKRHEIFIAGAMHIQHVVDHPSLNNYAIVAAQDIYLFNAFDQPVAKLSSDVSPIRLAVPVDMGWLALDYTSTPVLHLATGQLVRLLGHGLKVNAAQALVDGRFMTYSDREVCLWSLVGALQMRWTVPGTIQPYGFWQDENTVWFTTNAGVYAIEL